jgi:hypothetical protein
MRNSGWIIEIRKLLGMISTFRIFIKIFLTQTVRSQSQIFGNVESFVVMAHIKIVAKFTRSTLQPCFKNIFVKI